jgi:regulator of protease activity HflC (stomatin/prohibitin superfamily)
MSYRNHNEGRHIPFRGIIILAAIIIVVAIIIFMWSYRTVGAGEIGIVTDWGAPKYQVGEGLTIINPLWQDLIKMDIKTQRVDQDASAATKDLQNVATKIAVNYHLDPSKTFELYQTVGLDYKNRLIVPAVQETVKQITAKYTASQVVTMREQLKTEIEDALENRLSPKGIMVETVNIINVDFSQSFNDAIEATSTVRQNELKAQNQLNVIRIEAQQKVVQAEANYNATVTNAQAIADKAKIEAAGQEEAIKTISTALKENPEYILYLQSQRWNGQLPMFAGENGMSSVILNSDTLKEFRGNVTAPAINATLS